jgi:hypothetical protein
MALFNIPLSTRVQVRTPVAMSHRPPMLRCKIQDEFPMLACPYPHQFKGDTKGCELLALHFKEWFGRADCFFGFHLSVENLSNLDSPPQPDIRLVATTEHPCEHDVNGGE